MINQFAGLDNFKTVLDHGHIGVVNHMGSDLDISRAARVSYAAGWRAGEDGESDAKLIKYLWKNKHATPFEVVVFTFDVKLPIFVARQWHRHRTWTYNELSARYRELPNTFYVPKKEHITPQAKNNKQGREAEGFTDMEKELVQKGIRYQSECCFSTYKELLNMGLAKELARSVLPVNTYTHMQGTVNLRNLFGFLDLRCDSHAQYEIRVYAQTILELIRPIVPVAVEAWEAAKS